MKKKLATLGLAAVMAIASITTVFAAEPVITIYGQKPVAAYEGDMDAHFFSIIVGTDVLTRNDVQIIDSSWIDESGWSGNDINLKGLGNVATGESEGIMLSYSKQVGEHDYIWVRHEIKWFPADQSIDILGEDAKYVIYANGTANTEPEQLVAEPEQTVTQPEQPAAEPEQPVTQPEQPTTEPEQTVTQPEQTVTVPQPAANVTGWVQDSIGVRIQSADGSYIVNGWYQEPTGPAAPWYYLGADGYMLTNTTTPDGYWVNENGVWVP